MKEELLKGLSEKQIAKVKACKNQEELLAYAKEEGIELTDEQLEAVSGGFCEATTMPDCPYCGNNKNVYRIGVMVGWQYTCKKCKYVWIVESNNSNN